MNASQSIHAVTLPAVAVVRAAEGAGGLNAFRRLLESVWVDQAGRLASLALGLGLTRDEAGDVLQDVYVLAIERQPSIADEAGLARWLFRVTVNRCHLDHRRRSRFRRLWQSLAGAWRSAEHGSASLGELRRKVDVALARLAEGDRLLVVLRYFAGLNSRQIAEIVELPESTVRGKLRAARQQLAEELAEWNDEI